MNPEKDQPTKTNHRQKESLENSQGVVFPLLLILAGIILLLNSTGILSWQIWFHLWRFWPIMLILGGVQLILGQKIWAKILMGLLTFATLTIILAIAFLSWNKDLSTKISQQIPSWIYHLSRGDYGEKSLTGETLDLTDYPNTKTIDLNLQIDRADLKITESAEKENQINFQSQHYTEYGQPEISLTEKDQIVNWEINQEGSDFWFTPAEAPQYLLSISPTQIPFKINLDLGAGESTIFLGQTTTEEVNTKIGVGKLSLILGQESVPAKMSLEVGAGELMIDLPEEVGLKVNYSIGVGELIINETDYAQIGTENEEYLSPNYSQKEKKIEIDLNLGAGKIKIK